MGCGSSRDATHRTQDMSVDQDTVVWPNHICNKCAKSPIVGKTFKCENCSYMVCSKCVETHTHQHKLTTMSWIPDNADSLILQRIMQTLVSIPWHFVFVGDRVIAAFTTSNIARQTVVFSVTMNRVQLLARGICAVPQDKVSRVCQGLTYLNNEVSVGRFSFNPLDGTVSFQVSYIELSMSVSPLFREYLQLTIARLDSEVPRLRRLCLGTEAIEDIFPHDTPLQVLVERDTAFCRFLQNSTEMEVQTHGDFKGSTQQVKNVLLERKVITSDPTLEELRQEAGLYAPFVLGEIRYVLQLIIRNQNCRNIIIQMHHANGGVLSMACKYTATWTFLTACGFRNLGNETLKMETVDSRLVQCMLRRVEDPYSAKEGGDSEGGPGSDKSVVFSDRRSITSVASCVTDPEIHELLANAELMQSIFESASHLEHTAPTNTNTAVVSSTGTQ